MATGLGCEVAPVGLGTADEIDHPCIDAQLGPKSSRIVATRVAIRVVPSECRKPRLRTETRQAAGAGDAPAV